MADRLSPRDAAFLYAEAATTPMHVGGLAVFEAPGAGFGYDDLVELVGARIAQVPRYRQKVLGVPFGLGRPVWADDAEFDLTFHVRRAALPATDGSDGSVAVVGGVPGAEATAGGGQTRAGTDARLHELVGRLMSRRLDRSRPLWEIHLVEGLPEGRVAVITKTHHAMVDGVAAVDIAQVLLDPAPVPRSATRETWLPQAEPGPVDLLADAVSDLVRQPSELLDTARTALLDAGTTASRALGVASGLLAAVRTASRPAPESPLNAEIGEGRRFAVARTDLDDYKKVRKQHGGTVNDVVLATVAGAVRQWLLTRGAPVRPSTVVRAMVPVSVRGGGHADDGGGAVGHRIRAYLVDLPVGESNPTVRLAQVSYAMAAHQEAGQAVGADVLVRLSGVAPSTLHSLGARAASGWSRRLFNTIVTNVPGPQFPLYAGGARLVEMFPVVPLARGQAVSVGLTSYNGGVYYGLNADRDAMGDVGVLAGLIEESLAELVETVG